MVQSHEVRCSKWRGLFRIFVYLCLFQVDVNWYAFNDIFCCYTNCFCIWQQAMPTVSGRYNLLAGSKVKLSHTLQLCFWIFQHYTLYLRRRISRACQPHMRSMWCKFLLSRRRDAHTLFCQHHDAATVCNQSRRLCLRCWKDRDFVFGMRCRKVQTRTGHRRVYYVSCQHLQYCSRTNFHRIMRSVPATQHIWRRLHSTV